MFPTAPVAPTLPVCPVAPVFPTAPVDPCFRPRGVSARVYIIQRSGTVRITRRLIDLADVDDGCGETRSPTGHAAAVRDPRLRQRTPGPCRTGVPSGSSVTTGNRKSSGKVGVPELVTVAEPTAPVDTALLQRLPQDPCSPYHPSRQ